MIKKNIKHKGKYLKSAFISRRFLVYLAMGFVAFVTDSIVLNYMKFKVLDGDDVLIFNVIYLSKLVSSTAGLIVSFILNTRFAFKDSDKHINHQLRRFAQVYLFNIVASNILFSTFLYGTHNILGNFFDVNSKLATNIANITAESTKIFTNYILYKAFVYKV
ncbi:MAG: GtrA family protein [Candidatus Dojkabacteria bacterium]|nr:GtrA family protein [Candidatus Dojkabacteria bacterium]MDQ7021854.1 GtrA family protein [Candidatus Dojkabacteria bacterium]